MIRFENVTFIKAEVVKMKKEAFVSGHINIFWLDKDKETRKKMLSQVYDLCVGKEKASK